MNKIIGLSFVLLSVLIMGSSAQLVWTGATSSDITDDANWSGGSVAGILDVTLATNITFVNAGTAPIGPERALQPLWGVVAPHTITVDGVLLDTAGNDGMGAASVIVTNGGSINMFFVNATITIYDNSTLNLLGGGNSLPSPATVDLVSSNAVLKFENETWADFQTEHQSKVTSFGYPLEFGADRTVLEESDNAVATDINGGAGVQIEVVFSAIPEGAPEWLESLFSLSAAYVDIAYTNTLDGLAEDPNGDPITYSKASGPAWLNVATNGVVTGIPSILDAGITNVFEVVADDQITGSSTGILEIIVLVPSADGLIAHWAMEEGTGGTTLDAASAANDAIDDATWDTGAFTDSTASIDFSVATNPATYAAFSGIAGAADRTVTAWVRTSNLDRASIIAWGSSWGGSGDLGQRATFAIASGALRFEIGGGFAIGTAGIADGEWHHVAISTTGTDTADTVFWVDGVLDATADFANANPIDSIADWCSIGGEGQPGTQQRRFDGSIDELRVYDKVLTQEEVIESQGFKGEVRDPIGTIVIAGPVAGNLMTLSWDSTLDQIYNVETNANLIVPNWGIADTVTGIAAEITFTSAVDQVQMFYKVTTP